MTGLPYPIVRDDLTPDQSFQQSMHTALLLAQVQYELGICGAERTAEVQEIVGWVERVSSTHGTSPTEVLKHAFKTTVLTGSGLITALMYLQRVGIRAIDECEQ